MRAAPRTPRVLCAVLALIGCGRVAESWPGPEPCRLPGLEEPALCGRVTVPENRQVRAGRSIALRVVVLPARRRAAADPIFLLQGGPGVAASSAAAQLAGSPLRQGRDLVLLDQRGTGGSNPLRCDPGDLAALAQAIFAGAWQVLDVCRERLDADLAAYTTAEAMADLEAVRSALGYERINLWGASYGSLAAFEYLRRHPDRVRAVALQGVAPPHVYSGLAVARNAQRALDATLAACRADAGCAAAFPRPAEELAAVLAALASEPVVVETRHPGTGAALAVEVSREFFANVLRFLLYDARSAASVPIAIHEARQGDYGRVAEFALGFADAVGGLFHFGAMMSAVCAEDFGRFSESEALAATNGTFLEGRSFARFLGDCDRWPRGRVPEDFHEPVAYDGPVLLLSGALDPVTPPEWAERAADHLAASRQVVVPGAAHVLGPPSCVHGILARFFAAGTAAGLDVSCTRSLRRPAFVLPDRAERARRTPPPPS